MQRGCCYDDTIHDTKFCFYKRGEEWKWETELMQKIDNLRNNLTSCNQRKEDLMDENDECQANNVKYLNKIEDLEANNTLCLNKNKEMEANNTLCLDKIKKMEANNTDYLNKIDKCRANNTEYQNKIEELEANNTQYQDRMDECKANNTLYLDRIQELEAMCRNSNTTTDEGGMLIFSDYTVFEILHKSLTINLAGCVPECSPGVCEEQGNYKDDPGNWQSLSGRHPKHENISTLEECRYDCLIILYPLHHSFINSFIVPHFNF